MPARAAQDDYDSPWKEAVEHAFPEFMEDRTEFEEF